MTGSPGSGHPVHVVFHRTFTHKRLVCACAACMLPCRAARPTTAPSFVRRVHLFAPRGSRRLARPDCSQVHGHSPPARLPGSLTPCTTARGGHRRRPPRRCPRQAAAGGSRPGRRRPSERAAERKARTWRLLAAGAAGRHADSPRSTHASARFPRFPSTRFLKPCAPACAAWRCSRQGSPSPLLRRFVPSAWHDPIHGECDAMQMRVRTAVNYMCRGCCVTLLCRAGT